MTYAELVGARLRHSRGDRTAAEIAEAVGVTPQTWYRYEVGAITVPPKRYLDVAAVLGVPWHELFAPAAVGVMTADRYRLAAEICIEAVVDPHRSAVPMAVDFATAAGHLRYLAARIDAETAAEEKS